MKFFRSFAFELQSATLQLKIIECSADLVPTIFEDEFQVRSLILAGSKTNMPRGNIDDSAQIGRNFKK